MSNSSWVDPAERQQGLVTTAQLNASGLPASIRQEFIQRGMLQHRCRGVWAIAGWPVGWPQEVWETVLRAGPAAAVSRRPPAAAGGVRGSPPAPPIELALPPGHQSRNRSVHRVSSLLPIDLTVHNGLPITTVARTLADLGGAEPVTTVE